MGDYKMKDWKQEMMIGVPKHHVYWVSKKLDEAEEHFRELEKHCEHMVETDKKEFAKLQVEISRLKAEMKAMLERINKRIEHWRGKIARGIVTTNDDIDLWIQRRDELEYLRVELKSALAAKEAGKA
jgi:predicted  nucleic acid-binding Zn-ribbon protein